MRAVIAIAGKDLRQRLRDRSALLVGLVIPFALAAVFSLTAGDIDVDGRYVLVDLDGGPLAAAFAAGPAAAIEREGLGRVQPADSRARAVDLVTDGSHQAAFVIPAGFTDAIQRGEVPPPIEVLLADEQSYETLVAQSMARSFAAAVDTLRLSVAVTVSLTGRPPGQSPANQGPDGVLGIENAAVELRQLGGRAAIAAGMAIFFVFFTVQFAFVSLHTERREGTLQRMLSAPIQPWAVIAGKAMVGFVLGVTTVSVLVIAAAVLLDAEWGPPAGVAMLIIAAVVAAMGVMAIAGALARTQEQANAASTIIAIVFGLLGGSFFPTGLGPDLMARLSLLSPHAWWIRGLGELAPAGATAADAVDEAAVLLAYGLVSGAIAVIVSRRLVRG